MNVALSNANRTDSVFDYIDAALGQLYNKANSPNESPGLYNYYKLFFLPLGVSHSHLTYDNTPINLNQQHRVRFHHLLN